MRVEIKNSFAPISETQLLTFENQHSINLPSDYRNFLLSHNGGIPEPNIFIVNMGNESMLAGVQSFLGFDENDSETLPQYLKDYQKRVPTNLLPIAAGLTVDLVCMSIRGNDYGKVYFWDHNWEVTDGKADYSNVYLVAENFTDFLHKLHMPKEDK